jgi:hypothetical protein
MNKGTKLYIIEFGKWVILYYETKEAHGKYILSNEELEKMLNKSTLGSRLMWLLGPDLEKKITELSPEEVKNIKEIYEKVGFYALLIELLNITRKLYTRFGSVVRNKICLFRGVLYIFLINRLSLEGMKKREEEIKKGERKPEDALDLLITLFYAKEENIIKLIYALERVLERMKGRGLSETDIKVILEAFEEVDTLLEQIKEESKENITLKEKDDCFLFEQE